jgi:hypothetical protein
MRFRRQGYGPSSAGRKELVWAWPTPTAALTGGLPDDVMKEDARRATEDGRAALLEFITSQEINSPDTYLEERTHANQLSKAIPGKGNAALE